jgi:hypothetical protein
LDGGIIFFFLLLLFFLGGLEFLRHLVVLHI